MKTEGEDLPSVEGLEHLLGHFNSMGVAAHGFDGLVGFSWQEVESYCRLHFNYLPYWLPSLLHEMSQAYAVQSKLSTDPACISPYLLYKNNDTMVAIRETVHDKLKAF